MSHAYRGNVTRQQARSFGTAAERYDRYRPTYAADAVVWALGERPRRVLDVGAGTGILSRLLRRLGHDVIAVEPDELMRTRLVDASPEVMALAGAAEEIPLADRSVDAVVAGQSHHWFDADRAHEEFARVLRPDGVFAALWNDADPAAPWTVRFTEIIDGVAEERDSPMDFGERFDPPVGAEFRHELWLTPDELLGLATTRSPYLVASPPERQALVDAIRGLMTDAGLAQLERFPMPHVTWVYRAAVR